LDELRSLGLTPVDNFSRDSKAYFSATTDARLSDFLSQLNDPGVAALFALRGGYGSNYMLEELWNQRALQTKCVVGYSDVTSLQILLWQKFRWVSFYGPMVAAGLDAGPGVARGYDKSSLEAALFGTATPWQVDLDGEPMVQGVAEGKVL